MTLFEQIFFENLLNGQYCFMLKAPFSIEGNWISLICHLQIDFSKINPIKILKMNTNVPIKDPLCSAWVTKQHSSPISKLIFFFNWPNFFENLMLVFKVLFFHSEWRNCTHRPSLKSNLIWKLNQLASTSGF